MSESSSSKIKNRKCTDILKSVFSYRALIVTFGVPLSLLPLIVVIGTKEAKAAFIIITMSFYWNFEVVPLGITALMPVVLVPILGIMPSRDICPTYFKDSNMLFLGGLILAVSIEVWGLHKRVALKVLLLCGVQPRWLLFGFLIPTWILSMWISNTAAVAMMLPIVEAVLSELRRQYLSNRIEENLSDTESGGSPDSGATANAGGVTNEVSLASSDETLPAQNDYVIPEVDEAEDAKETASCEIPMKEFIADKRNAEFANIARMLLLSVAYGAVFGGVATMTGTTPNLILIGVVQEYFGSNTPLNYSSWLLFAMPLSLVCLLIAWLWLQISFQGFRSFVHPKTLPKKDEDRIRATLRREYDKLGSISYAEVNVILLFILTVGLWISREPGVRGWSALFLGPDPRNGDVTMSFTSDAQPVILSAILMFFLPSRNPFSTWCKCACTEESEAPRRERQDNGNSIVVEETPELTVTIEDRPDKMMTWKLMQEKVAWNIILMLGSGFALAEMSRVSGLSDWIGQQLLHLRAVPKEALLFIFCLFSALLTEWTSNGTATTILLPILASFSQNIQVHPFYFMISTTVSCSFAFILPISTPSNILVYSRGYLRATDMLRTGCVMWLISNSIVALATMSYAPAIFGLREFPDWASRNVTSAVS